MPAKDGAAGIAFGAVSLIAGIVVVATDDSADRLGGVAGIWFIIMGLFEIIGGSMLRPRLRHPEEAGLAGPAGSCRENR